MPAPRKPKKVFVQFAVALVIAAVFGVGALIFGFTIITQVSNQAKIAQEEAERAKAEAEAERERAKKAQEKPIVITYKMVQASADLVPGQPITKDMVSLIETHERPAPGTLSQISQALGKMVKSPIIKGETIEQSKLLDTGGFINVMDGQRAITIQVDNIGGLNGALSPGVRVDVLTTVAHNEKSITRTLLQNIQVMSVGDNSAGAAVKKSEGGGAVTLAVTPKQAEMLTLANQLGSFHLTLRNFNDKKMAKVGGSDITELVTGVDSNTLKRDLPRKPPEPGADGFHNVNYSAEGNLPSPTNAGINTPKFSMQIYRGTGTETVDFQQ